MDFGKLCFQGKETAAPHGLKDFLEVYTHCCLCGATLQFIHHSDQSQQMIAEESYCPSCKIRTKPLVHRLQ